MGWGIRAVSPYIPPGLVSLGITREHPLQTSLAQWRGLETTVIWRRRSYWFSDTTVMMAGKMEHRDGVLCSTPRHHPALHLRPTFPLLHPTFVCCVVITPTVISQITWSLRYRPGNWAIH